MGGTQGAGGETRGKGAGDSAATDGDVKGEARRSAKGCRRACGDGGGGPGGKDRMGGQKLYISMLPQRRLGKQVRIQLSYPELEGELHGGGGKDIIFQTPAG